MTKKQNALKQKFGTPASDENPVKPKYENLGYRSAVDPAYSIVLFCDQCLVHWTGCWDECCCPRCGSAEDFFKKTAENYGHTQEQRNQTTDGP